jgi:hypothetical protein
MSTSNELATFQYNKELFACFLVPKQTRKWVYGMLLHDIGWDIASDFGAFFMEDGSVQTFNITVVDKAVDRIQKGDPQTSEYILGLGGGKLRVYLARQKLRERHVKEGGQNPEADELLYINSSVSCIQPRNSTQSSKTNPPRTS